MASVPDFDPNEWETNSRELNQAEGAPIVNRATQSRYPPGSTMKVVTAAAALDSGEYTPDSVVSGESPEDDRRRSAVELLRGGLRRLRADLRSPRR